MKILNVVKLVHSSHDQKALIKSVLPGELGSDFTANVCQELTDEKRITKCVTDYRFILSKANIQKLKEISLRDIVVITDIAMEIILNEPDYYIEESKMLDEVINIEVGIKDSSKSITIPKNTCKKCDRISDAKKFEQIVISALEGNKYSPAEFILLRKVSELFNISKRRKWHIEAKNDLFPGVGGKLHSKSVVKMVIYDYLRSQGIIFPIISG